MNQQILDYIKSELANGKTEEQITSALVSNGWQPGQVKEAMDLSLGRVSPPPAATPPPPSGQFAPAFSPMSAPATTTYQPQAAAAPQYGAYAKIPGTFVLMGETFEIIKSKWLMLLVLSLIPFLGIMGIWFLAALGMPVVLGSVAMTIGLFLISLIATVFVSTFGVAALLYGIMDGAAATIASSISKALRNVVPVFWVGFLTFWVTAGTMFIPVMNIVMPIWLMFSIYIFLAEGKKGMDALASSKEYVRGYWWPVFGRILLLSLVIGISVGLINLILSFIPYVDLIAIPLVSLFGTLFSPVFVFVLYRSLKATKGEVVPQPGTKGKLLGFGIAGTVLLVLVLILFGAAIASLAGYVNSQNFQGSSNPYNDYGGLNERELQDALRQLERYR